MGKQKEVWVVMNETLEAGGWFREIFWGLLYVCGFFVFLVLGKYVLLSFLRRLIFLLNFQILLE
jgi:hypothetical protein